MNELRLPLGRGFRPLANERAADRFILCESPRGCGKTRAILTILLLRALLWAGSRVLIVRSTRTRLTESVLPTLEEQVFPSLGLPVPGGASKEGRHSYQLANGSVLIPMGLDDYARTQSVECAWIYVSEATEIDDQNDVLALAGTMRQAKMPNPQCIVDCNPGPPGHWLNRIAEPVPATLRRVASESDYRRVLAHNAAPVAADGLWKRLILRHQDNPAYWDHERWDWTQQGRTYLDGLGELRGHLRRRWLDGDWVAAEGAVYPEFDESLHVLEPFPIPRDWPCIVAKDPGRDHPDATLLASVAPNGRLYLVAESVVRQTTTAQDAGALTKLCAPFNVVRKLGDPHYMFSNTKMSDTGRTIAQQMRDFGHVFEPAPAARNHAEMAQQVEMVRTLLTTRGSDGAPMLQVFRTCPKTINGFQSWGYVRSAKGEMTGGEDRFEDVGDDEMDTVRMIVASRPTFETQTIQVMGSKAGTLTRSGRRYYNDDEGE